MVAILVTDGFEGVRRLYVGPKLFALLFALPFARRAIAQRNQLPRVLTTTSCLTKSNFRAGSDGQQFLANFKAIFETPEFAPGGRNQEKYTPVG